MDRLDAMQAFITVADLRGFAPAARKLKLSPPAVTRLIAALEERLGARLLQRTTRKVALTDAGTRYLERVRRILADAGAVVAREDIGLEAAYWAQLPGLFRYRARAGAITSRSDIVPYFFSASFMPATAPGTPTARCPTMLLFVSLPFASRYMFRLAASGAISR